MNSKRLLLVSLIFVALPNLVLAKEGEELSDYFAPSSTWEAYSQWRGYLELSLLASPHQWGRWTRKDQDHSSYQTSSMMVHKGEFHSYFRYGFRLGAMYVTSETFHLGAYFSLDLGRCDRAMSV